MQSVAKLMDATDFESALIILDGVKTGPFNYVLSSYSNDDLHAAWYSDTHSCSAAHIRSATAIVGRRNGAWWMHCHALWDTEDLTGMGHLLPDEVTLANDATVTLLGFKGGRFDVALDPETAFPIFHVHGGRSNGNALVAKVNPHKDIYSAIEELIAEAGFAQADIYGIGSLIGAYFEEGNPMTCPISEVLIAPGANWNGSLHLPMYCVDTERNFFHGNVLKDTAPVLITFEMMILRTDR